MISDIAVAADDDEWVMIVGELQQKDQSTFPMCGSRCRKLVGVIAFSFI